MTANVFDTLKAAKALKDAGFDEAQAEAVVATVDEAVSGHTAPLASSTATISDQMLTRELVSTVAMNVESIAETAATKESVAAVAMNVESIAKTAATKESVAAVERSVESITGTMATREHVAAEISAMRAEIAVEFKALYRHLWVVGTGFVGVTVALIKLLP